MSPPASSGTRKGSAATIASGSSRGQRRKTAASARAAASARTPSPSSRAGSSRRSDDLGRVPLVAEDQDREEERARPASPPSGVGPARSRIAAAPAAAATRTPRAARTLKRHRSSPHRGSRRRSVQAHHPARDQGPVLAEQFDPQLVAARRSGAAVPPAAVPVEGEEAVALQEGVAGEGDDQLAARLDHLHVGEVGAGDPEADADAVEAAIAVRREGADRRLGARHDDEGDPVEDERVALQALRPGEGGDRCEDEQREDDAARGALAGRRGIVLADHHRDRRPCRDRGDFLASSAALR